ncbi:hypothetical protein N665_1208s0003 [Sinapis alba]|nr:hypothetical protein N665_1208s0003 [Sinapis alba]
MCLSCSLLGLQVCDLKLHSSLILLQQISLFVYCGRCKILLVLFLYFKGCMHTYCLWLLFLASLVCWWNIMSFGLHRNKVQVVHSSCFTSPFYPKTLCWILV